MLIQEEAPRPVDPLATFDEDYERAVLHLAWDRNAGTNDATLLFAYVELLPVEVPPPLDDGEQRRSLGQTGEHQVHVRRIVASARWALRWYLDCRRGVALMPDDAGQLPDAGDAAAAKLGLSELGEEPPWPTLVCVSGESNTVPFCPAWHEHPRVHHLVPLVDLAVERLWPDATEIERTTAIRWLSERLHFRLEDYPEYWGSVHLVAPNPVYRSLRTQLQPRTPPRESVLVRFQPRAGRSVQGLELTYTEKEPWGPLDVRHVTVTSPLLRLDFDREVALTKKDVFDPRRGVIEASYHEAVSIKSFGIKIDRVSKTDTMNARETATATAARTRVFNAHHARRKRANAGSQAQRWFSGQQDEAANALRTLLREARREVLIVDPHFGPGDIFAFAVAREHVPIKILSSTEALEQSRAQQGTATDPGEALLASLDRGASQEQTNPVEVRLMTGDEPAIHDQFLVVDDRMWLLGAPLHDFGARGTMMVALPDPGPIREHLLKAWHEAMDLRRWVEGRRNKHGGAAKEGT